LKEWYIEQHRPENAALNDIALAQVLTSYWNDHGAKLASASSIKVSCRYWIEYWADSVVADITGIRAQEGFHTWLKDKGLAAPTVNRVVMVGKAALNRAWQNGEITSVPKLMSLRVSERPPKGRPLSIEEVRLLLECTQSDRLYRFILLMLGTASRPDAIREMTKAQCDFEAGLIHLNPPGRPQTKKYRPTVRMPRQLRPMLEAAEDGYLITYRGQPMKSLKGGWRRLRATSGLDGDVQPYSLRHTMARHLRASGVAA